MRGVPAEISVLNLTVDAETVVAPPAAAIAIAARLTQLPAGGTGPINAELIEINRAALAGVGACPTHRYAGNADSIEAFARAAFSRISAGRSVWHAGSAGAIRAPVGFAAIG